MQRRVWIGLIGAGLPILLGLAAIVGLGSVASSMTGLIGAADDSSNETVATIVNPGNIGGVCEIDPLALSVTKVSPYGRSGAPGDPDDQLYNAAVIIKVGNDGGMSRRDQQIALMTAMQESGLRNLDYGDLDSRGLFQQRPSQGWGTVDQIMDPAYAAGKFYERLAGIEDRASMSLTEAAQAVQRSAYPDAYARHEANAVAVLEAIYADTAAVTCSLSETGLDADQARVFMELYRTASAAEWDVNSCGCSGGCLVNCVSFSIYFINRYTAQHVVGATGNGRDVAATMAGWWGLETGHVPKPFAIFSVARGVTMCGSSPCGHTGVVLGVDAPNNRIIVGEAACGVPSFTGAHTYPLDEWSTSAYTYAYTDSILEGDPSATL